MTPDFKPPKRPEECGKPVGDLLYRWLFFAWLSRDPSLRRSDLAVAFAMLDNWWENRGKPGNIEGAVRFLAAKADLAPRIVAESINRLVDRGYFVRTKESKGCSAAWYRIGALPPGDTQIEIASPPGDTQALPPGDTQIEIASPPGDTRTTKRVPRSSSGEEPNLVGTPSAVGVGSKDPPPVRRSPKSQNKTAKPARPADMFDGVPGYDD
ncbi:hypothetical protein [Magnetospirillum sp. XM-1]|uniref:hypothetical protein n=1 Tax=Magnetospirillum sp. XM-1 TaxID=1663591 RepID=UPI0012E3A09B|nr:hypothetical protein [Magnetospirillum sp. XM-1]